MTNIKILSICLLLGLFPAVSLSPVAAHEHRHLLLLHSYHPGLEWTRDLGDEARQVLAGFDPAIELHEEFMDTKRHFSPAHLDLIRRMLQAKYRQAQPDLILVSDNNAFDFIRQHRRDLFPGVPVVFAGVNDFQDSWLEGHTGITGIAEIFDARATVEAMRMLQPGLRSVHVVHDHTPTGLAWARTVQSQVKGIEGIGFHYSDPIAYRELLAQAEMLSEDSAILVTVFFRDRDGRYLEPAELMKDLTTAASVPVYIMLDFFLGHGAVGGNLIGGGSQGRAAAELAVRILAGEAPASIPVVKQGVNQWGFDGRVLDRFGLARQRLPAGSQVINPPTNIWTEYRHYVIRALVLFAFLVFLIGILSLNVLKKHRAAKALKRYQAQLEERVQERTEHLNLEIARRKRFEEHLRSNQTKLEEINGILRMLARHEPLECIFERIVLFTEKAHPGIRGSILRFDAKTRRLRHGAAPNLPDFYNRAVDGLEIGPGVGSCGAAAYTGERVVVEDIRRHPNWRSFLEVATRAGIGACWSEPILGTDGELLGTFAMYYDEPRSPDRKALAAIAQVADLTRITLEHYRTHEMIERSRNTPRSLLDSVDAAVFVHDFEGRIIDVNHSMLRMYEVERDFVIGKTPREFSAADNSLDELPVIWEEVKQAGRVRVFDWKAYAPVSGRVFEVEVHLQRIELDTGAAILATVFDVEVRNRALAAAKAAEQEAASLKRRIEFILGATRTGLDIIDTDFNLRYVDPEWMKFYGDYQGRKCYEYFAGAKQPCPNCGIPKALESGQAVVSEEVLPKEGNRPVQVTTLPYVTGSGERLVAEVNVDISERKAYESKLRQLAITDSLTGLANRRHFLKRLQQEWERYQRSEQPSSLLMLDIDHFKRINDRYGHAMGDEVLIAVTKACQREIRKIDLMGRLGGEEFAILLTETNARRAHEVAERIRTAVIGERHADLDGEERVSVSIGVASFIKASGIDALMALADAALYRAKEAGRNRVAGDREEEGRA